MKGVIITGRNLIPANCIGYDLKLVKGKINHLLFVEESAAQGRSLDISIDGEVKNVPAKNLLQAVSEKD